VTATNRKPVSWQKTLWTMAAVQAMMMMAFSSSAPFLALFIEQLGVKDVHQVDVWAGVISSANFLVSAVLSPFWGAVADRRGKKMMVLRTTLAISFFTFIMGFSRNVWELLFIRMLQGAFSGYSASANALVATTIPEERLGFALGWLSTSAMVGGLLGPLLGGILSDTFHSYRVVFFLTAAFAMTAFALTSFLVREPQSEGKGRSVAGKGSIVQQFRSLKDLKSVHVMFFVLFIAQFSVMSVQPVLPLYIKELTHSASQLGTIAGFAFAVTGLADLLFSPFLGKRSDTLGYKRVLSISLLGAGLCYLPQALAPNIWVFVLGRFGLGMFVGGILPTANALVGRLTPREQRGQVYGFTSSSTFLGSFAGPLVGGTASAAFGIRPALAFTSLLYFVNFVWVRWKVKDPGAAQPQRETGSSV